MTINSLDVVIPSGTALTPSIPLTGDTISAIGIPSAWTAAAITFQGSRDGITWQNITSEGVEVSHSVAPDDVCVLSLYKFFPFNFIKVRSGTKATPVNQAANRTLNIIKTSYIV